MGSRERARVLCGRANAPFWGASEVRAILGKCGYYGGWTIGSKIDLRSGLTIGFKMLAAGLVLAVSAPAGAQSAIEPAPEIAGSDNAIADPSSDPTLGPVTPGKGSSGLALPRFVSIKSDRVNLRSGPGTDYPASWVFRRAGLPLEVTKEFENWRQVRDAEGTAGWVLQSFLSRRRTALVLPWEVKAGAQPPQVPIMNSDSSSSRTVAIVEAGVIANVHQCDSVWCHVTVDAYQGYIEQKKLWGVYDGEVIK